MHVGVKYVIFGVLDSKKLYCFYKCVQYISNDLILTYLSNNCVILKPICSVTLLLLCLAILLHMVHAHIYTCVHTYYMVHTHVHVQYCHAVVHKLSCNFVNSQPLVLASLSTLLIKCMQEISNSTVPILCGLNLGYTLWSISGILIVQHLCKPHHTQWHTHIHMQHR